MGCLQWFLIVLASCLIASGQQTYENYSICSNPNPPNNSYGYACNGQYDSCQAYAIYRAQAGYQSLENISSLLNSDLSQMAQINMRSDTQVLDIDTEIIAPIYCSCAGYYSQVNATYFTRSGDTDFIMANNVYEGLSTCQAIEQQNSGDNSIFQTGVIMTVPVRCACPTPAQVGQGILYLLSYLVREGDTPDTIAKQYSQDGATTAQLLVANDLNTNSEAIFPNTTLLVPLQKAPTNPPASPSIPLNPPASPIIPLNPPASPSISIPVNIRWKDITIHLILPIGFGTGGLVVATVVGVTYSRRKKKKTPATQ